MTYRKIKERKSRQEEAKAAEEAMEQGAESGKKLIKLKPEQAALAKENEYAVARFLKKDIAFLQIYDMIEYAMSKHQVIKHPDLSQILETERETYERLNKDWRNVSR